MDRSKRFWDMSDTFLNRHIKDLPVATLLCRRNGRLLHTNNLAETILGSLNGYLNLDQIFQFDQCDIKGCSQLSQILTVIEQRSIEHNTINLPYSNPPISHLSLSFSRFNENDEEYILVVIQDVSESKKLIQAFEYKENLLDNIITTSSDALIVFDNNDYIELFSPAAEKMFDRSASEMIIEDVYRLFSETCHEKIQQIIKHLKASSNQDEALVFEDLQPTNASGEAFPASITFSKSHKDTDSLFFMVISDKSLFQRFVNSVNDAYIKTDEHGVIIDVNNKTESLFHYDRRTLINKHISFLELRSDKDPNIISDISALLNNHGEEEDFITRNRRGSELTLNLTIWPQDIKNVRLNNLIIRDISQKKLAERQLITSAFTDSLTGLSNRANFVRELNELINTKNNSGRKFALIAMDLDKFKEVNDTYGHDYGDELLMSATKRITACVRDGDLVSRMGGDEFTIIIRDNDGVDSIDKIAERLLRTFRRDFSLKGKRVSISTSMGVSLFPSDSKDADELYKAADMAMYAAKRAGKDGYRRFNLDMYREFERQKLIENSIPKAIENSEFELHYQPKISYSNERITGFEALIRWNHEVLGSIPPSEFISIAEETGKILQLTRWVIEKSIKDIKSFDDAAPEIKAENLKIAVNISPDHFKEDIYSDIKTILERENFDPSRLEIEITESILLHHTEEIISMLNKVSSLGVRVSMDDFGTGYSSLQYLKFFQLNTIKIDRIFVHNIHSDPHNTFIIESIISIANRLNLDLVAEGVETMEELDQIIKMGCDLIQGFYFSKPLPLPELKSYFAQAKQQIHQAKAHLPFPEVNSDN